MKYLLSIICIMAIWPIAPAFAETCSEVGVIIGQDCRRQQTSQMVFSNCFSQSIDNMCVYKECNGTCVCAQDDECPSTPNPDSCPGKACENSNITWYKKGSAAGVEEAAPHFLDTSTCECVAVAAQRCAAGYYVISSTPIWGYTGTAGYAESVECSPCPAAEGDTTSYGTSAPPYVTSIPSATKSLDAAFGCRIKANTEIPDAKGKYKYPSECSYKPDSLQTWG